MLLIRLDAVGFYRIAKDKGEQGAVLEETAPVCELLLDDNGPPLHRRSVLLLLSYGEIVATTAVLLHNLVHISADGCMRTTSALVLSGGEYQCISDIGDIYRQINPRYLNMRPVSHRHLHNILAFLCCLEPEASQCSITTTRVLPLQTLPSLVLRTATVKPTGLPNLKLHERRLA